MVALPETHNSITISWEAGLNGGFEQHFKILYREKGKENYKESHDIMTGLKTGESMNYKIYGLDAKKEYQIKVVAINQFNDTSESPAAVKTVITKGKFEQVTIIRFPNKFLNQDQSLILESVFWRIYWDEVYINLLEIQKIDSSNRFYRALPCLF